MAADAAPPDRKDIQLGAVLAALADPRRRAVVQALLADPDDSEHPCGSFDLPKAKSTRSHHFRVLREAGLVRQVDHGNMSGITLRRADIDARFPGLLAVVAAEGAAPGV
jgi:DNA-binding transcriptional ArsR family regulator